MSTLKHIVLFGAGKSATVLIDYLKLIATEKNWSITVADSDLQTAQLKVGSHSFAKAIQVNIENSEERRALVQQADIVISMMPPSLHHLIALDCIALSRHLLTASYMSDDIKSMQTQIAERNLIFICEMGLDPGIDHMSAMKLLHSIQHKGGKITSFKSHCGGLVAPESDDNPWHYKISWNPRNIVLAGKTGAIYKDMGKEVLLNYTDLFDAGRMVEIPGYGMFSYYPNRDSLGYIPLYCLQNADSFIRTTLRHPEFSFGWKNIVDLKLTDEEKIYETDGLTVADFFKIHFKKNLLAGFLYDLLQHYYTLPSQIPKNLTEQDEKKSNTVSVAANKTEAKLAIDQLIFLGLDDNSLLNMGLCSAADILQFIIEKKLALQPADKDMIIMMHEIIYNKEGINYRVQSSLVVKGDNSLQTAMAKTVGLPLGIAAKLILEGKINNPGLHIPITPLIYGPVLVELEKHGIIFHETDYIIQENKA